MEGDDLAKACCSAGCRRIAAAKLLGWPDIGYELRDDLDGILPRLIAERDENTCRKDFLYSEIGDMALRLLAMEKPAAKERQKEAIKERDDKGRAKSTPGTVPGMDEQRARDKVGDALGVSGKTAERAARMVEAAKAEPDRFGG